MNEERNRFNYSDRRKATLEDIATLTGRTEFIVSDPPEPKSADPAGADIGQDFDY